VANYLDPNMNRLYPAAMATSCWSATRFDALFFMIINV